MLLSIYFAVFSFIIFFEKITSVDYSINVINRIDFDEKEDQIISNTNQFFEKINGKVIFCSPTSVMDNFCFYFETFSIAENHTFDCEDKYLGITISFPISKISDGQIGVVKHYAYLTSTIIGGYTWITNRQVSTTRSHCHFMKQ